MLCLLHGLTNASRKQGCIPSHAKGHSLIIFIRVDQKELQRLTTDTAHTSIMLTPASYQQHDLGRSTTTTLYCNKCYQRRLPTRDERASVGGGGQGHFIGGKRTMLHVAM
eukprot:scaffold1228_cov86-Alexandrium_tamarense.AAC.2